MRAALSLIGCESTDAEMMQALAGEVAGDWRSLRPCRILRADSTTRHESHWVDTLAESRFEILVPRLASVAVEILQRRGWTLLEGSAERRTNVG